MLLASTLAARLMQCLESKSTLVDMQDPHCDLSYFYIAAAQRAKKWQAHSQFHSLVVR
jgi:hypothetical protein